MVSLRLEAEIRSVNAQAEKPLAKAATNMPPAMAGKGLLNSHDKHPA